MRIAVIDQDKCQPRTCTLECIKYCPGVRIGDETIVMSEETGKPIISEELCTGCGICPKKCPYGAISIVGLADELSTDLVHQYGTNAFRLYRLPHPAKEAVTGLVGQNGIGKTTIVRILAGEIVPNLGDCEGEADRDAVLDFFRGTHLFDYFRDLYNGDIRAVHKPQYVDSLPKVIKGTVGGLLEKADETGKVDEWAEKLELSEFLKRDIRDISGGELQRLAMAAALLRDGDFYIFDEPSSYLDVGQRLKVARTIRDLAERHRVLVVEHDLIVMDYLADYVTMMYGRKGAYGIVSQPRTTRVGINAYLGGYLKGENIRFRTEPVTFEVRPPSQGWDEHPLMSFSSMRKSLGGFSLEVEGGEINKSEVIGVLGPNATGKTTFAKMLAGVMAPDKGAIDATVKVSYKPQYIKPEASETVLMLLNRVKEVDPQFFHMEVLRPLELEDIFAQDIQSLSGGELQRVAIAACLARDAQIYLLDEPSAYLDVEQRLNTAKMLRRYIEKREVTGIVVDHDILFTDYLSDRLMVFSGTPGVRGRSTQPMGKKDGMNTFLKTMGVTFRRDPETGRPRANKPGSQKDRDQKERGEYYYQS
jgi:ATP-binding cassette subfamily E protein 1